MASTQKRSSNSKSGSHSASGSRGGARAKKGQEPAPRARTPVQRTYQREIGAAVLLLLAFFGAIGYFKVDGAFITLFCDLLKGLCGYGFWIAPPMLLAAAVILALHRGEPVRLRTTCALLLPVLTGSILHLLLCRTEYPWDMEMLGKLWAGGKEMSAGGALSGLLAQAFRYAFSGVGALVVLLALTAAALLCVLRVGPAEIVDLVRERRERRPREPEEYEEPPRPRRPIRPEPEREEEPAPRPAPAADRRRPIDIPLDDPPVTVKAPTEPVTTVRKKKLFDKIAGVVSPDRVARGDTAPILEDEAPEYEDVPELSPIPERQAPEKTPQAEPEPAPHVPEQVPPAAAAAPEPVPIIREPAVRKADREAQVRQIGEEVGREIQSAMDHEPPAYRYPPLSLLREGDGEVQGEALSELQANRQRLEATLQSFGVDAHIVGVIRGPSVTRYELSLEQGVKLNKITNLSDDIALQLGATAVRVAPIPDKISTVGIEVPNKAVTAVPIRDVLDSDAFEGSRSPVSFAVGRDIAGNCIVGDIAKLPHMLIAGTTGSGKSVCTNSLIISLLYKSSPEEVRLIMVDPKMVELGIYNGIPHLLIPVVTDPKKAAGALQWAVSEMMKRYQAFSEVGAKDLSSYNNHRRKAGEDTLPQIVVVIDELADLMLVAAKEVEESICRVAQMGRASGMHLVIATQRPSADVITGLMKANIPSRIAFAVASSLESRIILDTTGAEKLVGRGDMLYFPLGSGKPQRVQGCFISEEEVAAVVGFIKQESGAVRYDEAVIHEIEQHAEKKEKDAKGVGGSDPAGGAEDYDELLPAAIEVVLEVGQASVSMLQRRLKLGYGRAARLVDQMEEKGVVGPFEGSKPRQLLITKEQWQEMQFRQGLVDRAPDYSAPSPEDLPHGEDEPDRDPPPFDVDE